ncbi:uncharacterized protein LOC133721540 [Rosa rugosa]|uniref:uncharacterized protein LOC133721540 n=1 Tax=Rosa rugosa TaxID=74645 RepID=UPI002B40EBBA|nr:uncharacterized protein LOC133721540 [Rosa rugosa]
MIALKHIQISFNGTRHTILQSGRFPSTKNSILRFSKSNDSDSESETPSPEGDTRKQELLVRIAMLQAQKVRLADYLDERSEYLTKFGEDATAEFDKIGEDALKGLDEASARIMENMDSRMQAFEESTGVNISEIEENENELAAFEDQIEKDRNEGLFFKNLTPGKPIKKLDATEEIKKIKELTKESAGSETRRNIYLVLIGLLLIEIVDSFITSTPDWRKVAFLGVILVGLVTQFIYEQKMLSEKEIAEEKKTEEERR